MKETRINTGGINSSIHFKPEKKSYSAPVIISTEDGIHTLENGNTISVARYNAMWLPQKTKVLPVGYKGENKDKTKVA